MGKGKARAGGKIAIIICMAVIVVLAGMVTVLLPKSKEDVKPKRDVVVNEVNAEKIASELIEEKKTAPGYYEVAMNSTWNFENGAAASDNAYVENVKRNTNSVYFDIVRSDNEETIYESPILPVDTYLEDITLDSQMEAGTYNCICTYHLLDEDENPVSKVNVGLTIIIRN